jgi:hypothetical protein
VVRLLERLRRLKGRWAATPFRGTMELEWPAPALDDAANS